MLTHQDTLDFERRGVSTSLVEEQLHRLREGIPPVRINRPCRLHDGIIQLDPAKFSYFHEQFEKNFQKDRFSKFIPASGAATRMFKELIEFLQEYSTPSLDPAQANTFSSWD